MKHLPNIIGVLLGLAFVAFGLNHFFHFLPAPGGPKPEPGSPMPMFMGAIKATGFLTFVKLIEIVGAIFVAVPKTRNWGLLLLGPIVVGILATNVFIKGGSAVFAPPVILISIFSAYLLWAGRAKFLNLISK